MKFKSRDGRGNDDLMDDDSRDTRYGGMIDEMSRPREREEREERADSTEELYQVSATVGHVVDEMNGLLYDINNVVVESENNIVANLHTLNENLKRISGVLTSLDSRMAAYQEEAQDDRVQMMNDIAFIKGITASGAPVAYAGLTGSYGQHGSEELRAEFSELKAMVRDQSERNKRDIVDEVRRFRDHMLVITMARVSENGEDHYETYNEILLSELRALKEDLNALDIDAAAAIASPVVEYRPTPAATVRDENPIPAAAPAKPKTAKPPVKRQPLKPRKVVTPVVNNDLSISEILSKINATDVKIARD